MIDDEEEARPAEQVDKPRYRVHFETSADSPEELDSKIAKGMARHIRRGKRKARRKAERKAR